MPIKQQDVGRPDARKMLSVLRATKSRQDVTAQPNRGRGLWLSTKLWLALTRHLEQQAFEMDNLKQALLDKEEEAEKERRYAEAERSDWKRVIDELQTQAVQLRAQAEIPLAELDALRSQMRAKQEAWEKEKYDLEAQLDRLMGVLRKMGLLADSEGQRLASAPSPPGGPDYTTLGLGPNAPALQLRELSMLLAEARHQAETYRRQLAMRSIPGEEMALEIKRLKVDNQRLVALLAKVPEYRSMAAELAAESGVHYIPLEECLMMRGLVDNLHPQQLDRPVDDVAGTQLAAAGRRRDPDVLDPNLTLVLDEQYHWVPRRALETGAALLRRLMPALPMSQLLMLVAELNKVWRDRERQRLAEVGAAHREELRRLRATFQQRAPYEAVVASQKLTDLKRRMRVQAVQSEAAAKAAKAEHRRAEDDSKVMLHAGLSSIQDLSRQVARLTARNKKLTGKAARQQRALAAAQQQPPLCTACLDRMLLHNPAEVGPPQPLGAAEVHQQHQHQQAKQEQDRRGAAAAAAAQAHGPHVDATAAALPVAHYLDVPDGYMAATANDYDEYGSQRTLDSGFAPAAARLGSDIPTFNLSTRGKSGQAASTEPYNAGAVVRVTPVPQSPARAPGGGEAAPVAAMGAPTLNSSRHRSNSVESLSLAGPQSGRALNDAPRAYGAGEAGESAATGTRAGGAGAGAAMVELSTASLADWRAGTCGAPVTVQIHVGGSSPARTVVLQSPRQGSDQGCSASASGGDSDSGGGGGSTTNNGGYNATGVQVMRPRGVPVRVRVRFPRQDVVATTQQVQ